MRRIRMRHTNLAVDDGLFVPLTAFT